MRRARPLVRSRSIVLIGPAMESVSGQAEIPHSGQPALPHTGDTTLIAGLMLATVLLLVGGALMSEAAAATVLFTTAVGLALVSLILARQRRRLEAYAAQLQQKTAALSQSEARFRAFAMVSSDWFWEQDAELRFSYVSDDRKNEYIGALAWELTDDVTSAEHWAAQRQLLADRRAFKDFRFERVSKGGRRRCYSISG